MSDSGGLQSGVVIRIVAASTFVFLALIGAFAHFRPKSAAVRWFDRIVPLIQVASFVVVIVAASQTVVPCCFIVWVLLHLFAALRGEVGSLNRGHATDRNGDIIIVAHSSGVPDT